MTVRLGDYKSSAALSVMAHLSRVERTFTRVDAEAMAEGVEVITRALLQPVGCARASAERNKGDKALVTAEEYDGAVVRVLCCAFMLVNSGKLMTGELFELDGEEEDDGERAGAAAG